MLKSRLVALMHIGMCFYRGKSQKGKDTRDWSYWTNKTENESAELAVDVGESCNIPNTKAADTEVEAEALSFHHQLRQSEHDVVKKVGFT